MHLVPISRLGLSHQALGRQGMCIYVGMVQASRPAGIAAGIASTPVAPVAPITRPVVAGSSGVPRNALTRV